MRYFGGKNRIGRQLASVINKYIGNKDFYSLFTGSGGVEQYIKANNKYYNDLHPFLKILYDELVTGWLPTIQECSQLFNVDFNDYYSTEVEAFYYSINTRKDLFDIYNNRQLAYICIIGFGGSFGGKWMDGLARNKENTRNFFKQTINTLENKSYNGLCNNLRDFTTLDYKTYANIKNAVVYLDPPYANTTGYTTSNFDNNEFWEFAIELSKNNIVFVSEYKAHKDFQAIQTIKFTKGISGIIDNLKKETVNELLLVHKSLILNNSVSIEPKQLSFFDKEISHYTV